MAVTNRSRRNLTIPILSAGALLLSACGGGNDDSADNGDNGDNGDSNGNGDQAAQEHVYDFEQVREAGGNSPEPMQIPAEEPVTVQLSNELAAVVPDDNPMAVQSFELTTRQFDTGTCVIDAEVTYENGGHEALTDYHADRTVNNTPEQMVARDLMSRNNVEEPVDSRPADEDLENGVTYFTADGSELTTTYTCSEDAEDGLVTMKFPYTQPIGDEGNNLPEFAEVDVVVNPDGSMALINASTEAGYSVSGDWEAPED